MRRSFSLLIMAALATVAIVEGAIHRRQVSRALGVAEYAQLRQPVSSLRQPGEAIEVAPSWAGPYVRQALGDVLIPIELLARSDDLAQRSVLTIALHDQLPKPRQGWAREELSAIGPFRIYRQHNPGHRPVRTDFVAALHNGRVKVQLAGKPCNFTHRGRLSSGGLGGPPTFPQQRFQCPGGPFFFVGKTIIADQHFRPRQCLWAHPPSEGVLSIRFEGVALATHLVGHSGMYWITERTRRGAPVQLRVIVDGAPLATVIHADGDGWAPFSVPLGVHAGKAKATVQWQVSSPDHRHRHFCFEARSL